MVKLPTTQKVFDVVGEGRMNDDGTSRQEELTGCEPGEPVELIRQPSNAYDRNAIFVRSCRSVGIGYLAAEDAAVLAPALDGGRPYSAKLHALTGGLADYPHYGAKVSIAWDGRPEHPHRPLDASQLASRRGREAIRGRQRDAQGRLLAKERSGCAVAFLFVPTLLASVLLLTSCDDRPTRWDAFVYPDFDGSEAFETMVGFKTFEQCQSAAISRIRQLPQPEKADYECGYKCRYDPQMKLNVCKETKK